jgi:hypothetical protein
MKLLRRISALALTALAASLVGCGDDAYNSVPVDAGEDSGVVDTETETESESESETEAPDAGDTDQGEAAPGEPCWKASFGDDHPNAGLPNCGAGYVCVGDSNYAFCSETCDATGDIDASGGAFDGWCCGEFSNPCDPVLFWLPVELSHMCIPRTAALAETCVEQGAWPSTDVRCAPRCDGATLVSETICETSGETPFCTFPCASDTDVMCGVEDAFLDGCCELYGASYECTPSELCGA